MKLAIATDETIRAYAVWRAYHERHEKIVFRITPTNEMTLPDVLMDQTLRSFNIQFPGNAKLIQREIGSPWVTGLEGCLKSMWDKKIPAHLILSCMVDTMIVQARVMSQGRPARDNQASHERAVRAACTWYKPKQADIHTRINSLLDGDRLPLNKSIAHLQLGLIEIIDIGLTSTTDTVIAGVDAGVGFARGAVRGAVSVTLSTATVATGLLFGLGHKFRRDFFG